MAETPLPLRRTAEDCTRARGAGRSNSAGLKRAPFRLRRQCGWMIAGGRERAGSEVGSSNRHSPRVANTVASQANLAEPCSVRQRFCDCRRAAVTDAILLQVDLLQVHTRQDRRERRTANRADAIRTEIELAEALELWQRVGERGGAIVGDSVCWRATAPRAAGRYLRAASLVAVMRRRLQWLLGPEMRLPDNQSARSVLERGREPASRSAPASHIRLRASAKCSSTCEPATTAATARDVVLIRQVPEKSAGREREERFSREAKMAFEDGEVVGEGELLPGLRDHACASPRPPGWCARPSELQLAATVTLCRSPLILCFVTPTVTALTHTYHH